jgi:hypothetical protein
VVEGAEELHPELHAHFFAHFRIFVQAEVPVVPCSKVSCFEPLNRSDVC